MVRQAFKIGDTTIEPGHTKTIDLTLGSFSNHMPAAMPVKIIHGKRSGPTIFVSAAVHGDEIIGVEIVRRLLQSKALARLKGTLITVPIVNTFGFVSHSRYLPDRRDLNRCFPGSDKGSLAGQLAHMFMKEIVQQSDFGIDLHSAAAHRANLPQIRYCPKGEGVKQFAEIFGAPLLLEAPLRDGSLRMAAREAGVEVLLYEAGEAFRFNEYGVKVGVRGILNVLASHGMIKLRAAKKKAEKSLVSSSSRWLRAPTGGIFRAIRDVGDIVREDEVLGYVADAFGGSEEEIKSTMDGVIIGMTKFPIGNPGDALFHIARLTSPEKAGAKLDQIETEVHADPLLDEDEII